MGVLLCLIDLVRTLRRPHRDHGNPWKADSLEWLPQGDYGMRSIPQVASLEPLWAQPSLPHEVAAGQHWLPGTVFGGRETLVTSPVNAQIRHLLRLPGDGWAPFVAAAGTAGFFLLLTVAWIVPAFIAGAVSVAAMLGCCGARTGRHRDRPHGRRRECPCQRLGRRRFVVGPVILLAVDATYCVLAVAHTMCRWRSMSARRPERGCRWGIVRR